MDILEKITKSEPESEACDWRDPEAELHRCEPGRYAGKFC